MLKDSNLKGTQFAVIVSLNIFYSYTFTYSYDSCQHHISRVEHKTVVTQTYF